MSPNVPAIDPVGRSSLREEGVNPDRNGIITIAYKCLGLRSWTLSPGWISYHHQSWKSTSRTQSNCEVMFPHEELSGQVWFGVYRSIQTANPTSISSLLTHLCVPAVAREQWKNLCTLSNLTWNSPGKYLLSAPECGVCVCVCVDTRRDFH